MSSSRAHTFRPRLKPTSYRNPLCRNGNQPLESEAVTRLVVTEPEEVNELMTSKKTFAVTGALILGLMGTVNVASATSPGKVTVCNETGSETNPYVELEVGVAATKDNPAGENWYAVGGCPGSGPGPSDGPRGIGIWGRSDASDQNDELARTI